MKKASLIKLMIAAGIPVAGYGGYLGFKKYQEIAYNIKAAEGFRVCYDRFKERAEELSKNPEHTPEDILRLIQEEFLFLVAVSEKR